MSIEEFKTIVKFFTVGQMWCILHPLAPGPARLREMQQEQKRQEFKAIWDSVPEDELYEDTGYVPEDWMHLHSMQATRPTQSVNFINKQTMCTAQKEYLVINQQFGRLIVHRLSYTDPQMVVQLFLQQSQTISSPRI